MAYEYVVRSAGSGNNQVSDRGNLVSGLQDMLADTDLSNTDELDESTRERLLLLAGRLRRIHSWGGDYSEVGFSPEFERLLKQIERQESHNRSKVLV